MFFLLLLLVRILVLVLVLLLLLQLVSLLFVWFPLVIAVHHLLEATSVVAICIPPYTLIFSPPIPKLHCSCFCRHRFSCSSYPSCLILELILSLSSCHCRCSASSCAVLLLLLLSLLFFFFFFFSSSCSPFSSSPSRCFRCSSPCLNCTGDLVRRRALPFQRWDGSPG